MFVRIAQLLAPGARLGRLLLALALLGLFLPTARLNAITTIIYVNASVAGGAQDGTSWANAYPSLASALTSAVSGSEIWVAKGTYKPTSGTDRTATFTLKNGVAIYGGFASGETQRDQRNWSQNVVTLSGDLGGDDGANFANNAENSLHVVTGATGATVDGVTISGGNANGGSSCPNACGGGMFNSGSSPTVTNVTINGNFAANNGGGMFNTSSSSPSLTNVTFSGNKASAGGGMLNSGSISSPTLSNVTFISNIATNPGGGMYTGGTPTLTNVTFSGNSASSGGGMYNFGSSAKLTNVTFSGNSATGDGGGIVTVASFATLTNVIISGNTATSGGGMSNSGSSSPTITNVIISGNKSTNGGGMSNFSRSTPTLTNVTISGNSATANGGGLTNDSGSAPIIRNSIVWGNSGVAIINNISTPTISYSIVQGSGGSSNWASSFGTNGGNNQDADPLFIAPTALASAPTTAGNLHLSVGSPAIDAGNKTLLPTGVTTDLDANPRIFGGKVDLGAYEVQTTDATAPTASPTQSPAANGAGWNYSNVTVSWNWADNTGGTGIDTADCTTSSTASTEGASVKLTATCKDKAGNIGSATYTVKLDATAPTIAGSRSPAPNAAGWNNSAVTVHFTCSDALSGLATGSPPADSVLTGEGANLSVMGTCTDNAGNSATNTQSGIKIDTTAPTTSLTAPAGWNNSAVNLTLDANDNLSGVASTWFSLDGGAAQSGSSIAISAEGVHTVEYWSVDQAGNAEVQHSTQVKIDTTAPSISHTQSPAANANGWNNSAVTVTFVCADALSGIASCTDAQSVTTEGQLQPVNGTATDNAGNSASDPATVSIDTTAPTISAAADRAPNADGWYNDTVLITFTCDDTLSGVASCTAAQSLGEGTDQSASGSASDAAGNSASTTLGGINVDTTAPSITGTATSALNADGWYSGDVTIHWSCSDARSGLASACPADSLISGDGENLSASASVSDLAGNVASATVTVKIDRTAPAINGSRTPAANSFGWNNGPVAVSFSCADTQSGVAGCDPGVTLSNEGIGQSYTGQAIDKVGNTSSATVDGINIDLTAPTLSGAPTTSDNAAGWYNGDVTIHWTGSDALSGIDDASQPGDSLIAGEGRTLGAGPATIRDQAGNQSAAATVSGIKIDRHGPTISGAPTSQPNAAGWYSSAVTVAFSCADPALADGTAGSGVANCSDSKTLSGDGAGQSVTSDVPSDFAGNSGAAATVGGINIDGAAPQTSAAESCTAADSYCRGQEALVVLTAADQAGLSGVKEIHYIVNGGTEQIAAGASVSVSVPLGSQSGSASVQFWAVDVAGNVEARSGVSLNYDNLAPTVTHSQSPKANANDWNNSPVTLDFSATDDTGVNASSWVNQHVTVSAETAGQTVSASVADMAGNVGSDAAMVKIDMTKPTISGAATTAPNANGWYKGTVTIRWTCADAGAVQSGVASCSTDDVITAEGAAHSRTGAVSDKAGNQNSATVSAIKIDGTAPVITIKGLQGSYTLGQPIGLSCSAVDSLSGVNASGCTITVTGGNSNGVGKFTYTATATDLAGNTATSSGTYSVKYRWDGFLQPINDTAHQIDQSVSIFKAGSTIPVKFQLKRADGTVVQALGAPIWEVPAKGSSTAAAVNESAYSAPADSTSTYRWSGSPDNQYIFNWNTDKTAAGYYWRIGVKLDDGQTYYVNIGLR